MNFAILLTPKQYLIAFVLAGVASFIFLFPWLFGTTPSRLDHFPARIAVITEAHEAAIATVEEKTRKGESAILKTDISSITISKDERIQTTWALKVKNIIDSPAIRARIIIKIYSTSTNNCFWQIDWNAGFDAPLNPDESVNVDFKLNQIAMLSIRNGEEKHSNNCAANKIKDLIGTHKVSKVEAFVNSYELNDPTRRSWEQTYQIGPTIQEISNVFKVGEKLESCATVIALLDEDKFTEEDAEDFENHGNCFRNIGIYPRQGTFREQLKENKELRSQ